MFIWSITGDTHDNYQGFKSQVYKEQAKYDPNVPQYKYSDDVRSTISQIKGTEGCPELKTLFIDNYGWSMRPMIADKIVTNCFE